MARRKSLGSQILGIVAQRQKEAQRRAEQQRREHERAVVAALKEQERRQKAEEARLRREDALQAKLRQQKERERAAEVQKAMALLEKREREKERQEAQEARAKEKAAAADERRAKQEAVAAGHEAATAQEAAAQARIEELSRVLRDRDRTLAHLASAALDARTTSDHGLENFILNAFAHSRAAAAVAGHVNRVVFQEHIRELLIDCELPPRHVVPQRLGFKFSPTRGEISAKERKDGEIRRDYANLAASVVLRTIREALDIAPREVIDTIVVNAHLSAVDAATGRDIRPCVLSVSADRSVVDALVLDQLDPATCLRAELRAIVSPNPFDLEPVKPVMAFDLARYKFAEHQDVIAGLDSRLDLLSLSPAEFEHLVRQLVEAMGMEAWATQASNDDGIDAVAINPAPMIGGLCIIQAKRYSKVVGPEPVHALAGQIQLRKASRGILMTTSWVSSKTEQVATEYGRLDIYDGRALKALLLEYLSLDTLISLPVVPRGWTEADIA